MNGRFITFEGGEGSGKSTQVKLLAQAMERAGLACVTSREPGGSEGAEKIRALVVNGEPGAWDAVSETLLFCAARADHVKRFIQPTLRAGKHVVCDRFFDSTVVYQGHGKGLGEEYVTSLHRMALGNFAPELTIVCDIDPAIGLVRAQARMAGEARFESMPLDFHHMVRAGFLSIATREPNRCVVVDASGSIESVHQQVLVLVAGRMGWNL